QYSTHLSFSFSLHDTATPETSTLSLHDALPISEADVDEERGPPLPDDGPGHAVEAVVRPPFLQARIDHDRHALADFEGLERPGEDRKSTRLNSSHVAISYAVFCLKKKNKN